MNIDFSLKQDGAGSVPVETTQSVSTPVGDSIACRNTHTQLDKAEPASGLLLGDVVPTFDQIILPRVNLVHSVGGLKDSFPPGAYIYDQRVVLYVPPAVNLKTSTIEREGTPPVIITALGFRPTRYVENVKGGSRGLYASSEAEVTALGGTLNYQEFKLKEAAGMKRFDYLVEAVLAIERPAAVADDDTVFSFEVDGAKYALALYGMKASAYTVAKRTFFTARSLGCLRGGYPAHSWALSSILTPTPDKSSTYWKPVLVPHRKSTPAFLEFAASVLNAKQVDTPEAE